MKVLLGHLGWGLGTKGLHSDSADKTFFGSAYCKQCFLVDKPFVKTGVKTSVAGSCTTVKSISFSFLLDTRFPLLFNKTSSLTIIPSTCRCLSTFGRTSVPLVLLLEVKP